MRIKDVSFADSVRARNLASHRVKGKFRLLEYVEIANTWIIEIVLESGEHKTIKVSR